MSGRERESVLDSIANGLLSGRKWNIAEQSGLTHLASMASSAFCLKRWIVAPKKHHGESSICDVFPGSYWREAALGNYLGLLLLFPRLELQ
jgi:hypothetical protein